MALLEMPVGGMRTGIYQGDDFFELVGERALLRPAGEDALHAQFDNLKLAKHWTHAWPKFDMTDFTIDPMPEPWPEEPAEEPAP